MAQPNVPQQEEQQVDLQELREIQQQLAALMELVPWVQALEAQLRQPGYRISTYDW